VIRTVRWAQGNLFAGVTATCKARVSQMSPEPGEERRGRNSFRMGSEASASAPEAAAIYFPGEVR
jgi:hypothetical protein